VLGRGLRGRGVFAGVHVSSSSFSGSVSDVWCRV
ncbi:hypothetical protein A2U01_0061568, partial [Trifolium medium]|nr:hypothetical protein [Trifolium medium]